MAILDFLDLMPDTVELQELVAHDAYGRPQYGSPASYRARLSLAPHRLRQPDGHELLARGAAWLASTEAISPEALLTLPDGSQARVVSVELPGDEAGRHHVKLYFL